MSQSLRIGLVCPYNMTKGGGVQECVRALQAGLRSKGHYVKIVTPLPRANGVESDEDVIYVGRARDIKSPFATVGQISVSLNTKALEQVLDEEDFDIIHYHEPWVPIVSRQILTKSKAKNVATFHAKLPDTMMSKTIERVITPYTKSIMSYLHGFTAVSDAAAEYVSSITNEPIETIPNGIHLKNSISQNKSSNKQILYVGRLERRKGLRYLLEAFEVLLAEDDRYELIIAGDGPDRGKLELLAQQLELDNHVKFLGYIDESHKHELFKNAAVFCSPALYGESFGIVLLEAMAHGLPIVAGNNPGYTGVMQGIGAVSIVNPKDETEFARRLKVLTEEQDLRKLWKAWAKTYVKQYEYDRIVDLYEDYYKKLLKA